MSWFFIALIAPVLYAIANHTDKYLISKYLKGGEVGALVIFSSIFSVVALPVVLFFNHDIFSLSLLKVIFLALNGMLIVIAVLLYFYALHKDEATYVVPFYQIIPIFAFILGFIFLGEAVAIRQIISALVIILGALILSFDFLADKIRFKKEVVILMLSASLLYAVNNVMFKVLANDVGFWPSTFWGLVGKIILGIAFFAFIPSYRDSFINLFKNNKISVLGLNSLSEASFIVGESVTQYATLLAPVALVLLVNSFQPLFVFLFGILFTVFLPSVIKESVSKKQLIQKGLGIALVIIGSLLI